MAFKNLFSYSFDREISPFTFKYKYVLIAMLLFPGWFVVTLFLSSCPTCVSVVFLNGMPRCLTLYLLCIYHRFFFFPLWLPRGLHKTTYFIYTVYFMLTTKFELILRFCIFILTNFMFLISQFKFSWVSIVPSKK